MEPSVKVTQLPKPFVTLQDVEALLLRLYTLRASKIKEFSSYADRVYYVKTAPGEGIGGHTEFIFKVLNAEYTNHGPGAVSTQMDILNHLKSFPELKCQVPMATVDGKLLSYEVIRNDWKNGNGSVRSRDVLSAVQMYRYLPGQTLHDISPLPPSFFYQAGRHLGNLQQALQTYPGDVAPLKQKANVLCWCLDNVPWVQQHLDLIQDISKRMLVEEVIAEFEKTVVPVQGELRKGIVNHDFNDYNVLVMPSAIKNGTNGSDDKTACDYDINGLIDFDEMVYTCLVHEIAVSMMYLMLCSDEPLEVTAYLLAGFESRAPLPPNERRLLRVLAGGRFAQTLVYGLFLSKLDPDNAYITSTQDKGWKCLELLWGKSEQDLLNLWDRIAAGLIDRN